MGLLWPTVSLLPQLESASSLIDSPPKLLGPDAESSDKILASSEFNTNAGGVNPAKSLGFVPSGKVLTAVLNPPVG